MRDGRAAESAGPVSQSPRRRPGSVRRTQSLDAYWPAEHGFDVMRLEGRGREIRTAHDGTVSVLSEVAVTLDVDAQMRTITSAAADNESTTALLQSLTGHTLRSGYRRALREALPDDAALDTMLFGLLDDAAATYVAIVAMARWPETSSKFFLLKAADTPPENTCLGYATGSSGLEPTPDDWDQTVVPAAELARPDDPWSSHELPAIDSPAMRRSRMTDVWRDGETYRIETWFQDSSNLPDGTRHAVHEYIVRATAEIDTGRIIEASAEPRVLPFQECPAAALGVERVHGMALRHLRTEVARLLPGVAGCTHLNDTLRSLSAAPQLVRFLP